MKLNAALIIASSFLLVGCDESEHNRFQIVAAQNGLPTLLLDSKTGCLDILRSNPPGFVTVEPVISSDHTEKGQSNQDKIGVSGLLNTYRHSCKQGE